MFKTEEIENGLKIIEYLGNDYEVVVPEKINGLVVTHIGNEVFRNSPNLMNVVLPETIISLGNYAFCDCRKLKEIYIPKNVEEIGGHCFYNCRNLEKIIMPSTVKYIGDGFIKNCEKIRKVSISSHKNIYSGVVAFLNELKESFVLELEDIKTKLFYPEYDFEYSTNSAAKVFITTTLGSGQKYRLSIETKGIDFKAYDLAFPKALVEEKKETCFFIAITRLMYDYFLGLESKDLYTKFLKDNIENLIEYCIKEDDIKYLEFLSKIDVFDAENINICVEKSAQMGNTEFSSFILDLKFSKFNKTNKKFEI